MSLAAVIILNAVLGLAIVAVLAYTMQIPLRVEPARTSAGARAMDQPARLVASRGRSRSSGGDASAGATS